MISDEALMLDFQRGSREAFDQLYARYRQPLCAFFHRRLANPTRAEDLTQETFLAVIHGLERYEPRALVRTYLYGIAMNVMLAERRKQSRDGVVPENVPEPAFRPTHDRSLWVREALGRLDESEREIVMLREYEQLSYDEIAELMHLPVNTVRSRLFRARMVLKQLLQPATARQQAASAGAKQGMWPKPVNGEA